MWQHPTQRFQLTGSANGKRISFKGKTLMSKPRPLARLLLATLLCAFASATYAQNKPTQNPATPTANTTPTNATDTTATNAGDLVPEFSFTDFAGKTRKFSEFRGKVVLLDFWATWCKPCLAEIPKLKELYAKYNAQGFEILGMDSETLGQDEADFDAEFAKETQERARQIVQTRGVNWTQATSETAVPIATKIFGVSTLPSKILVDREGKIIAIFKEGDDLDKMIGALLSAK